MGSGFVFWIVCGCLIFLLCKSLWCCFRAIRTSVTKQETNDMWCGIVNSVFVYSTFIVLYATETLGYIYDYIYEYIYWHLGWHHFVWSEGVFLFVVILIWILCSLPASILKIITTDRTKEVIKEEFFELYKFLLVPYALTYIILIEIGPIIWALVPFLLGLLPLGLSIADATNNFRHTITWRMMLWTTFQAIIVLGLGIVARELMVKCWQLSVAMGLSDYSYAANLISIVIIGSVIVEFLFAADEHFKPKMYISMSPSDIDEWKEKHQAELYVTTEHGENKANVDTEVKDE